MFKKGRLVIVILLMLLVLITPISLKASTNVLQISNTSFEVIRGQEFDTTIYIEEGSNVTGLTITLVYDSSLVSLKDYEELDDSIVNIENNNIHCYHFN